MNNIEEQTINAPESSPPRASEGLDEQQVSEAISQNETNEIPSFQGELLISFPTPTQVNPHHVTVETFTPKTLLRGSDKWAYPYPNLAQAEDSGIEIFVEKFGEPFVLDLFLDALTKFCQAKWRSSVVKDGDPKENFISSFFEIRRDTGPTSAKTGLLLAKKLKEFREQKEKLGKTNPKVLELHEEIQKLKKEMNELMAKEMEL